MQKKYATDSLAAVSVSLDDPSDAKLKEKVVKFLESQHATFTNLILEEKPEVWQNKLKFDGPPCVFVFDRDGKWTKFEGGFEYTDVENLVKKLLKK